MIIYSFIRLLSVFLLVRSVYDLPLFCSFFKTASSPKSVSKLSDLWLSPKTQIAILFYTYLIYQNFTEFSEVYFCVGTGDFTLLNHFFQSCKICRHMLLPHESHPFILEYETRLFKVSIITKEKELSGVTLA